jgi:predicted transposase YbfD/YdcC
MAARKLRSVLTHFRVLDDPRLERTRRHELLDIVAITLCAVICGADSQVDVEKSGTAKRDWLKGFLKLPNGIPSHDTIGRVFAALDPEQFRTCFTAWVAEVADVVGLEHIAIDGKALRGSRGRGKAALHRVSAWATGTHLTLGQEAVGEKSNEITAIPRLLEILDLSGALVTIDAMGCQREIASQVVARGGDDVLTVKGNQRTHPADHVIDV